MLHGALVVKTPQFEAPAKPSIWCDAVQGSCLRGSKLGALVPAEAVPWEMLVNEALCWGDCLGSAESPGTKHQGKGLAACTGRRAHTRSTWTELLTPARATRSREQEIHPPQLHPGKMQWM